MRDSQRQVINSTMQRVLAVSGIALSFGRKFSSLVFVSSYDDLATKLFKAGFHMIADDRGSQIAESSAIVCDHMETHFCDRLRSCDRDRRRSQTIAEDRTMFYLLRSSAIICDRLRSCDHMETKVLRSAMIQRF